MLKRNQGQKGTAVGMEVRKEGCGVKSNERAERKTAKGDFAPSLCHKAGIAQQAKMEEEFVFQVPLAFFRKP